MEILKEAKKNSEVKPDYVLMHSFYAAAKLLKLVRKLNKVQVRNAFRHGYGKKMSKLTEGIKAVIVKDNLLIYKKPSRSSTGELRQKFFPVR